MMRKLLYRRKNLYIFAICVLSSIIFAAISATAYAITSDELDKFAANNIMFYDPDGCDNGDSSSGGVPPTGDKITWIGDSYSVGAQNIIKQKFSGLDVGGNFDGDHAYVRGCKFVADDTACNKNSDGTNNENGLSILQKIIEEDKLRPYLVFALGTNGGWTDDSISKFDKLIKDKDVQVVLVTSKTPNDNYEESNKQLKKYADSNDNIHLADWAAKYDANFFSEQDRIHPTQGDGYKTWVETIYSAFPDGAGGSKSGGGKAGLLPGDTNIEMIWNWFVNANISGVSDNSAALAAIIGNMIGESGGDPFIYGVSGSTYYGLYMEVNTGIKKAVDDAGLGKYWHSSTEKSTAPKEAIEKGIDVELNYLVNTNSNFSTANVSFLKNVDVVSEQTPESYAELFVVTVERAICPTWGLNTQFGDCHGFSQPLKDQGVANFVNDKLYGPGSQYHNNIDSYQGVARRREHARETYDKYAATSGLGSGKTRCENKKKSGFGGAAIAAEAINIAWPEHGHDMEVKPEYLASAKKTEEKGVTGFVSYATDYQSRDCGKFVTTAVMGSGADDSFFRGGGKYPTWWTPTMEQYLAGSDIWEEIPNTGNVGDLKPGDVFVINGKNGGGGGDGHIYVHVGDGKVAQASYYQYSGRMGPYDKVYFSDRRGNYRIFRNKSDIGGSVSFDSELKALEVDGIKVGFAATAMGNTNADEVVTGGSWTGGRAWSSIKVPLSIAAKQKNASTSSVTDPYGSTCNHDLASAINLAITKSDNCAAWQLWSALGGNSSSASSSVESVLRAGKDSTTTVPKSGCSGLTSGCTNWSLVNQAIFAANLPSISGASSILNEMKTHSAGDKSAGLNTFTAMTKGGWSGSSSSGGDNITRQFGIVKLENGKCSAVAIGTTASGTAFSKLTEIATILKNHQSELPSGECPGGL